MTDLSITRLAYGLGIPAVVSLLDKSGYNTAEDFFVVVAWMLIVWVATTVAQAIKESRNKS